MWCQRPGVTQRKTVRPGRLHQHVSVQPQRRRGPPIPSASAARVPTASSRTPAMPPRRIRRIAASLATPRRRATSVRRGCATAADVVGLRGPAAGLTMTTWSRMTAEAAKGPPPDCRRIVIRLRYGIKGRSDRRATSKVKVQVNVHANRPLTPSLRRIGWQQSVRWGRGRRTGV
jgi:hypothetical protein